MEANTAQAVVQDLCAAHDVSDPLRRCLETEADALLRTLRLYVARAGLAASVDIPGMALEVLSLVTVEYCCQGRQAPAARARHSS